MTNQWTGKCSGCGAQIVKDEKPRPCHVSKLTCDGCKLKWRQPRVRNYIRNRNGESINRASLSFNRWDIVDETWLLDNAGSFTYPELADKLGRSIKAIEMKLVKLRKAERERSCV